MNQGVVAREARHKCWVSAMKWTLDSNGVQATKSSHCHQLRDQSRKTRQGITWSSHTWTNTKNFWWAFLLQAGPIQTILDHAIRLIFLNKTCKNKTSPALIPHFCEIYPCYPFVPSLPFQPDLPQLTTSCVYTSHAPGHICIHCLPIQPPRHNLTAHFQVCSTIQPMKAPGKSKNMKRLGKHCISSLTFGKLLCNCYTLNQALPECKVHAVHHYFVHRLYTYKVIIYDTVILPLLFQSPARQAYFIWSPPTQWAWLMPTPPGHWPRHLPLLSEPCLALMDWGTPSTSLHVSHLSHCVLQQRDKNIF